MDPLTVNKMNKIKISELKKKGQGQNLKKLKVCRDTGHRSVGFHKYPQRKRNTSRDTKNINKEHANVIAN